MKLLLENWREYINEDEGKTFYHFSNEKFDKFSLDKTSDSAIWGNGIYLSDSPDGLSGWGKEDRNHGFLYKVEIKTDPKNIIDMTQRIPPETYERFEEYIGRPLADITKEDGIFPFNTLDRKGGSVANAMRAMGFEVLKHPPPGAHKGNHYLVVNPSAINILEEPRAI
jgi:hypothetical protein